MSGGLRGDWAARFPSWAASIRELSETIERVPVKILVWGPGETSPDYPKRRAIIEHLEIQSEFNEVLTSEELMRADPLFGAMHLYDAERIHWQMADIVIVVIPRHYRATGPRAETAIFRGEPEFRAKACLIVPRLTRSQRRGLSFLDQGWHHFPNDRRFAYTDEEFQDCSRIRGFCAGLVAELRALLGYQQFQRTRR
jgi:hypothetical protein